jgi:hypothetical protein
MVWRVHLRRGGLGILLQRLGLVAVIEGTAAPSIVVGSSLTATVGEDAAIVVREVLKNRLPLTALSAEQRLAAAAFFRDVASRTVGKFAADAARYNIARAEFLEGTRAVLSPTLPEFIANGF